VAEIEADLHRPHAFAYERVGFVLARWAVTDQGTVAIPYDYLSIGDEHYLEDPYVGAKIDGAAIRAALQKTLSERAACLHVHAHTPSMSYFGGVDLQEQGKLIPSFVATLPGAPHGALLLYGRGAAARVWRDGELVDVDRVVEVGFPLRVSRRAS
jgi:hypothetical protein